MGDVDGGGSRTAVSIGSRNGISTFGQVLAEGTHCAVVPCIRIVFCAILGCGHNSAIATLEAADDMLLCRAHRQVARFGQREVGLCRTAVAVGHHQMVGEVLLLSIHHHDGVGGGEQTRGGCPFVSIVTVAAFRHSRQRYGIPFAILGGRRLDREGYHGGQTELDVHHRRIAAGVGHRHSHRHIGSNSRAGSGLLGDDELSRIGHAVVGADRSHLFHKVGNHKLTVGRCQQVLSHLFGEYRSRHILDGDGLGHLVADIATEIGHRVGTHHYNRTAVSNVFTTIQGQIVG